MAIPVVRVHLAMAHAALPGLLPTPPEWKVAPLLPTPPCADVFPKQSPPTKRAGRADAVERWDACKNALLKSSSKPGRADAAGRWDARKITTQASSASSGSSTKQSVTKSSSSSARREAPRGKRPVSRGSSSSDERWDAHKKPRPPHLDDGESSSTGSNDMEVDDNKPKPQLGFYAGPGFLAPPEPSMLPMPSFLVLPRCMVA